MGKARWILCVTLFLTMAACGKKDSDSNADNRNHNNRRFGRDRR